LASGFALCPKECNLGFKIFQGVKGSINGGESKVGDFIQLAEWSENGQSNLLGRDFAISAGTEIVLNALSKYCEIIITHRSPLARFAHTVDNFHPIKGFKSARALHDVQGGKLRCCEPASAVGALTTTPDG
jgi:hypothetical protein